MAAFLERSGVHAFFALSWIITCFSHDLTELETVARVFDAWLSSAALFPLYLAAAVVRHRREELLSLVCDFSVVHSFLSRLPEDLPFDDLIMQVMVQ